MTATAPRTCDTADRLRPGDHLDATGRRLLIADITDASTPTHPARLAVLLTDPHGRTFDQDGAHLLLIDAGNTITFEVGRNRSARPYAALDTLQVRERGTGVEVLDTVTGEWVYLVRDGDITAYEGDDRAAAAFVRHAAQPLPLAA